MTNTDSIKSYIKQNMKARVIEAVLGIIILILALKDPSTYFSYKSPFLIFGMVLIIDGILIIKNKIVLQVNFSKVIGLLPHLSIKNISGASKVSFENGSAVVIGSIYVILGIVSALVGILVF